MDGLPTIEEGGGGDDQMVGPLGNLSRHFDPSQERAGDAPPQ